MTPCGVLWGLGGGGWRAVWRTCLIQLVNCVNTTARPNTQAIGMIRPELLAPRKACWDEDTPLHVAFCANAALGGGG